MRSTLIILLFLSTAFRFKLDKSQSDNFRLVGRDKPAYQLYTATLKATTYAKLLHQAAQADVVLFGELHNNPICHWLEFQLTKDLQEQKANSLVLGAEMFETDNQSALNNYIQGRTSAKEFSNQARLWPNYDTDYKPIADFARDHHIPFIATNVPRQYARLVSRQGLTALDTVSAEAKRQIAPLPLTVDLTLPGYKAMMDMMKDHGSSSSGNTANPHGGATDMMANFARAQAIKDATMAYFILQNRKPGQTFLHFNGDYHSKNFEGIVWYLRQQQPDLKILTISSVEQPTTDKPANANRNLASFVLVIPADMTKTY